VRHLGTETLNTPRLTLRRFTPDDAEDMYRNWAGDDEVTRFLTWPTHKNAEESREILLRWEEQYESEKCYLWCIELKQTGRAIGSIGAVKVRDEIEAAEIGYCIGRAYWHRGLTSEAFSAVIDFFFSQVGLNRIEAYHDPNNPNSGKVMRKCGLLYEGTRIQADKNNTGICDAALYGMINPYRKRETIHKG